MKSFKKIIALTLALLLMVSIAAPAFAAADEPEFNSFFLLGDSISIKCNYDRSDKSGYLGFSKDSYSEIIAKHYNIEDAYCCAYTGWRTQEALIPLDPSYTGDIYTTDWQPRWGHNTLEFMQSLQNTAIPALEKADLIVVNLGSNNIIGTIAYSAAKVFEDENAGTDCEKQAIAAINEAMEANSEQEALCIILQAAKLLGQVKIVIDTVIKDLVEAIGAFPESWDSLIARVREINPDATMAVIGLYNAIGSDIRFLAKENGIDPDTIGLLADALDDMTKYPVLKLNYTMQYGSEYSDEYIFVDNSDVNFEGTPDGSHIGPAGHAQVAEKIIAALNENYKAGICTHENTQLVNVKEATKYSLGYSGDVVCADCGVVLEKGSVTFFHCQHENTTVVGAVEPTHLTLGYTGTHVCADCGKVIGVGHVVSFWSK